MDIFRDENVEPITMTELLLGIFLSLLALVGFLFNVYIVLALVLTKQVEIFPWPQVTFPKLVVKRTKKIIEVWTED